MTITLLVKVKVTIKETGVSRETGCDNFIFLSYTTLIFSVPGLNVGF